MRTDEKDDKKPQGITSNESLNNSITTKLMEFENDPTLIQKKSEVEALLTDFSLHFNRMTLTENKEWVQKILATFDIRAQPFASIPDTQYADHVFELVKFITERQHTTEFMNKHFTSSAVTEKPPFSDQLKAVNSTLGDMTQNGDALPPRNRRSTDPKTPPTQATANTNTVEKTKGPRALLHGFLSKIIPKKSDQASQVDPQKAAPSSNVDKPQDRSNSPRFK